MCPGSGLVVEGGEEEEEVVVGSIGGSTSSDDFYTLGTITYSFVVEFDHK